jgi:hypothetical protein
MFRLCLCTAITNLMFKAETRCRKAVTPRQKKKYFYLQIQQINVIQHAYATIDQNTMQYYRRSITVACSLGLSSWTSPALFVGERSHKTCLQLCSEACLPPLLRKCIIQMFIWMCHISGG